MAQTASGLWSAALRSGVIAVCLHAGGRVDFLRGLKENVIMGRLVPAGTGLLKYKNLQAKILEHVTSEERAEAEASHSVNILR